MNWTLLVTPDCWEKKLIDYFLRFGANGDAQDIRWFEVTPVTLAEAFADSGVSGMKLKRHFEPTCRKYRTCRSALKAG